MIGTMNQANFLGMMLAGPLYQLFAGIAAWADLPASSMFWMTSALVLPMALFYRHNSNAPRAEARS
jgi:hypothetical protein